MSTKRSYADKLKDPRWQKKRLEILEKANWTCAECGDTGTTLHVHHLAYCKGAEPWEYPDSLYRCLCEECHEMRQKVEANFDAEVRAKLSDVELIWLKLVLQGIGGSNARALIDILRFFAQKPALITLFSEALALEKKEATGVECHVCPLKNPSGGLN